MKLETRSTPRCNSCGQRMYPAQGIIAIWRCRCSREIPRTDAMGLEE